VQVYSAQPGTALSPDFLIKKLYALPHGADFQDGGQHDCQEALRGLIQALHDDLVGRTFLLCTRTAMVEDETCWLALCTPPFRLLVSLGQCRIASSTS
jgi:hypothetical protein